jgi:hypothetical protein
MENKQVEMFKSRKPSRMMFRTPPDVAASENDGSNSTPQFHITPTDHHVIEIVSTYIKKLPDKNSKKHIARIMINFIMKSANL